MPELNVIICDLGIIKGSNRKYYSFSYKSKQKESDSCLSGQTRLIRVHTHFTFEGAMTAINDFGHNISAGNFELIKTVTRPRELYIYEAIYTRKHSNEIENTRFSTTQH